MQAELTTDREISIDVEEIRTPTLKEAEEDYMVQLKIAQAYYRHKGYEVLLGHDFEQNMLIFLSPEDATERMLLDDYLKVKLWRSKRTKEIQAYGDRIVQAFGTEKTKQMLFACRLCSFLGGPGVPEIILIKDGKAEMRYIKTDRLLLEQFGFAFLVRDVMGICKLSVSEAVPIDHTGQPRTESIAIRQFLENSRKGKRSDLFLDELDQLVKKETNSDEIEYLETQKHSMPFFIFEKWLKSGSVDPQDILDSMEKVEKMIEKKRRDFTRFHTEILRDENYRSLGPFQDNETMKKKMEYVQNKFSLGDSRAKDFLKFITSV